MPMASLTTDDGELSRVRKAGIGDMISSSDSGNGTLAQQHFLADWEGVIQQCEILLRKRGFPDYRELAEDLAQDAYVKLGSVTDERWKTIENSDGYIYQTLRNLGNGLYREYRREQPMEVSELLGLLDQVGQNAELTEVLAILVEELLVDLPENDQKLFYLLFDGYNPKEIAAELNLSYGAVRQRISRLGKKLRDKVYDDKDPP